MKCSVCGAENQNGKFCQQCGEELEKQEKTDHTAELFAYVDNISDNSDISDDPDNSDNFDNAADDNVVYSTEDSSEEKNAKSENNTFPPKEEFEESLEESDDLRDIDGEAESGTDDSENVEISPEVMGALEKYEQGTIPDPKDKPKPPKKKSFLYPQNPMLWSFLMLLLFAAVLGILSAVFFHTDLEGKEIVFGIVFLVFTAAVLGIDFAYYFPSAIMLDRLLKGKGARLEYSLKKYELIDLAEQAKKRNRGFYLAIGLFGLAFTIYYIYILATTVQQTTLMWISLIFSASVFVICATLFFVMPKFNYGKMMENGSRVIIGNKSVYYGGTYYHWIKVQPDATFAKINTKKHELEITFTQEFKNGNVKKQRVTVYAPDTALKGISKLLGEYEVSSKKFWEKKKEEMSVVDGKPNNKEKA
ncbi:MAG: hypothetical protein HDT44_04645 [Ruminococcaceae bacterium]|nr:hypothetical protein [Oscillospiraceae bacterium]